MPPLQWMSTYATHQDEHTHTHARARGGTHMHACTCTHTYTHAHAERTHARAHTHTHTHTHTSTRMKFSTELLRTNANEILVVVVAISSLARNLGKNLRFIPRPRFLFFFFLSGDQLMHTSSTFQARIRPLWLSEIWCALLCTFAHVGHRSDE